MKNIFNSIKLTKPKTNVFDLTHDVKLSCNMGFLVPIMCTETVPGDRFSIGCEALVRFAPIVSPVMHRHDVTMHYYFVPNRLVWPGWEQFIVNEITQFPTIDIDENNYTALMDYLGIPNPIGAQIETVSAIPFAAYQLIYNEYYRDQNLIPELNVELVNGDNSLNGDLLDIRRRAWEHDYFTSALPFAQKGAAVQLPIAGFNDVKVELNDAATSSPRTTLTGAPLNVPVDSSGLSPDLSPIYNGLYAKTSDLGVTQSTINDLRRAYRLQEWLEKNARGGTRYVENILSHFGVKSSDKRLQRPEYITGTKSPVVISEVLNTTGTADAPQGEMAGHGISVTHGKYGGYFCEEHGYIIGIMSILPRTAYQQGIPKHFTKTSDAFQWFWPAFANIGEQAIENRELYAFQGATGADTFGYVPRYSEYKYEPSRVAGDFRTTLDFWHNGRIFASPPALNQAFIECNNTSTDRIFAVPNPASQKIYVQVVNKVKAVRPMPKYGTPTF